MGQAYMNRSPQSCFSVTHLRFSLRAIHGHTLGPWRSQTRGVIFALRKFRRGAQRQATELLANLFKRKLKVIGANAWAVPNKPIAPRL